MFKKQLDLDFPKCFQQPKEIHEATQRNGALVSITCCYFQVDVSYIFHSASLNIVVLKHPTMDVTFVKVCYSQVEKRSEQESQSSAPDQSKQSDISLDVYSPRRSGSAPDPAAA